MKLLDENKKYYKANLHCHTILSDGRMTPEEVKARYMEEGYSIVAFTDHEVMYDQQKLTDENFVALNGVELSVNEDKPLEFSYIKGAHFNFIAKTPNLKQFTYSALLDWVHTKEEIEEVSKRVPIYERKHTTEDFNKVINMANDSGFLSIYNHPSWSLHNYNDYIGLKNLFAVEIINTGEILDGLQGNELVYDDLLRVGNKLNCLCSDDNHLKLPKENPKNDCCLGYIQVQAEKLTYSSVISALEKRNFYSSTGPSIYDIDLTDDVLKIKCSPCVKIIASGKYRPIHFECGKNLGDKITYAEFKLNKFDKEYLRITVIDEFGKKAFSNAYYNLI